MEGKFNILALTPIGPERGELELREQSGALTGILRIMGNDMAFDASAEGGEFSFRCELRKKVVRVLLEVRGRIEGNDLVAVAASRFGDSRITGKRCVC